MTLTLDDLDLGAVDRFFWYARERQVIYLKRRMGLPAPWTTEPTMAMYSITNVFRENDRTTRWFREYVRDPLRDRPEVLLATMLFRWFNTIRSGETLFLQGDVLQGGLTPWEAYLRSGDLDALRAPLRRQGAPWVTGAYMIRTPEGLDKLDGVLKSFHDFAEAVLADSSNGKKEWFEVAELAFEGRRVNDPMSLEYMWKWLKHFYGMGPFLAYEVVTDLRFTALLDKAPDIMTWANPGPGALRGAGLLRYGVVMGRKGRLAKASYEETHEIMALLLKASQDKKYWPQTHPVPGDPEMYPELVGDDAYAAQVADVWDSQGFHDWPAWEMREPEMWLCEFAKLERTRLGLGRPRGRYP